VYGPTGIGSRLPENIEHSSEMLFDDSSSKSSDNDDWNAAAGNLIAVTSSVMDDAERGVPVAAAVTDGENVYDIPGSDRYRWQRCWPGRADADAAAAVHGYRRGPEGLLRTDHAPRRPLSGPTLGNDESLKIDAALRSHELTVESKDWRCCIDIRHDKLISLFGDLWRFTSLNSSIKPPQNDSIACC
jgi:hypothetical protein